MSALHADNYLLHVDSKLVKSKIPDKGYGIIAKSSIPANTIIIKEKPAFTLNTKNSIISDMYQLLYMIYTCDNEKLIHAYNNFYPHTIGKFTTIESAIIKELTKLKATDYHYIYDYFIKNYSTNDLILMCAKYMCNAFTFADSPAILFTGTLLNHSCKPNVVFKKVNNQMYFTTIRDIKAGEEICDHYGDINENKKIKHKRLLKQYGFVCEC